MQVLQNFILGQEAIAAAINLDRIVELVEWSAKSENSCSRFAALAES